MALKPYSCVLTLTALCFVILTLFIPVQGLEDNLESECRPYVEKALKNQLEKGDPLLQQSLETNDGSAESTNGNQLDDDHKSSETHEGDEDDEVPQDINSDENADDGDAVASTESTTGDETQEIVADNSDENDKQSNEELKEHSDGDETANEEVVSVEEEVAESQAEVLKTSESEEHGEDTTDEAISNETIEQLEQETTSKEETKEDTEQSALDDKSKEDQLPEQTEDTDSGESKEEKDSSQEEIKDEADEVAESADDGDAVEQDSVEEKLEKSVESSRQSDEAFDGNEEKQSSENVQDDEQKSTDESTEKIVDKESEEEQKDSVEKSDSEENVIESENKEENVEEIEQTESVEGEAGDKSTETAEEPTDKSTEAVEEADDKSGESKLDEAAEAADELAEKESESTEETEIEETDEDELTKEFIIPDVLRERNQLTEILHLDEESSEGELALAKAADSTLRELKRLYDTAIKPLEILYKYRDLSNRHFGDPEIFSKPLILFMGPWSGGKSSIINYLLDNEYTENSLRTGAEPSPAYFNIVTWGAEPEVLDGTQLAADWTFSGLQKFGQGLEDRLRGLKLPNKLLEMVNIVEIPGILEVRKQVSRVFPFNDACQWFIDRADVIFLVYDPSKLDVGPETEAILDQLKGREYQTRVILNKADTVKPEELLRVQGALLWNISPLMSSPQPPIIYTTSLWSTPYNSGSPVKLLQSQERAFLRDIRQAIIRRVENKITSARRFAVRVRNHAKMVDCYLTTYYNHKTLFGNKKQISDDIIENPEQYHIYQGLSTLKNISRYDLPDPDTYRDFFKVNPLYDFQPLSSTCTYFKGCPINRLDVCIAYDLPELVGKHKKLIEQSYSNKATLNS